MADPVLSIQALWEQYKSLHIQGEEAYAVLDREGATGKHLRILDEVPENLPATHVGDPAVVDAHQKYWNAFEARQDVCNQIAERTRTAACPDGLKPTIGTNVGLIDDTAGVGKIVFTDANMHEAPDTMKHLVTQSADAAAKTRTWAQAFTENKNAVKEFAQEHRVLGGIAGVAGVAAGGFMTYDGFKRVRSGLGFDTAKDGKALEGSIVRAAVGTGEMAVGTGLAVLGGYTAIAAIRGGKAPPTLAP